MGSLVNYYNRMDHCCCEPDRGWTVHSALKTAPFALVSYLAPEVFTLVGTVMAAFESHVVEDCSNEWKHLRCHFHEGVALAGFARSLVSLHHGEWLEALEHAVAGLVSSLCSYPVRKQLREDFDEELAEKKALEPAPLTGEKLGKGSVLAPKTPWAARYAKKHATERAE